MNTVSFLSSLFQQGVQLWFEDEALRYRAPKGVLTKEIGTMLKARKPEIRRLLGNRTRFGVCSIEQRRMWLLDRMSAGMTLYNLSFAIRIDTEVTPENVVAALETIASRHETLRTTFTTFAGLPVQVVHSHRPPKLTVQNARETPLEQRAACFENVIMREASHAMNLREGPLWFPTLLTFDDALHYLVIGFHHIIVDGWSGNLFYAEFAKAYEQIVKGEPNSLKPLAYHYSDYARDQLAEINDKSLGYWHTRLAGIPDVLNLVGDRPRPMVKSGRGDIEMLHFPKSLTEEMRRFCARREITPFIFLQTTLSIFLYAASGRDCEDVVMGTLKANRDKPGRQGLIGFLANTLALRTKIQPHARFLDLLTQVKQNTLADFAHGDLPFERILDDLKVPRTAAHSPVFQVLFILLAKEYAAEARPDMRLLRAGSVRGVSKFDLTFYMLETEDGLDGTIEYDTDQFDAETIRTWLDQYHLLVEHALMEPERRVAVLSECMTVSKRPASIEIPIHQAKSDEELPFEAEIRGLFAQILEVPEPLVDRGGNFFALGGDSLRAGVLLSLLAEQTGVALSIPDLLRDASPAGLAERILEQGMSDDLLAQIEDLSAEQALALLESDGV